MASTDKHQHRRPPVASGTIMSRGTRPFPVTLSSPLLSHHFLNGMLVGGKTPIPLKAAYLWQRTTQTAFNTVWPSDALDATVIKVIPFSK